MDLLTIFRSDDEEPPPLSGRTASRPLDIARGSGSADQPFRRPGQCLYASLNIVGNSTEGAAEIGADRPHDDDRGNRDQAVLDCSNPAPVIDQAEKNRAFEKIVIDGAKQICQGVHRHLRE